MAVSEKPPPTRPAPPRDTAGPPVERDGEENRLDRELIELLNEIRVALPGVQVLFAFLLTVPFTQRFGETDDLQRDVYFAVLLLSALATALLMAPTAFHRLRFRKRDKNALVLFGNRMALTGMSVLSLAISGAVFLVGDFVFSRPTGIAASAAAAAALAVLWYVVPLARRDRNG
jgi:uncharacterized protein DUF6328